MKRGDESRSRILVAIFHLSALYEYSPTVREIAEAVGLRPSPTHKHLRRLVDDGKVLAPERVGAGWKLTEDGLAEAAAQRSITNAS